MNQITKPCRKNGGWAPQILCSAIQGPRLASRNGSAFSVKEHFNDYFCRKHVNSKFYIPTGNSALQLQRVTLLSLLICIYLSIVWATIRVELITTNGAGWCSGNALHGDVPGSNLGRSISYVDEFFNSYTNANESMKIVVENPQIL